MSGPVLENDADFTSPHFIVLKASAGSGKTYQLSLRFVQYLLSDRVSKNGLRNILAMTFSNNAAKEMKERILKWLKLLSLGDEKSLDTLSGLLSCPRGEISGRASNMLDVIFDQYADFQVKTIDSFMAAIFKASALDFGYQPEFEIRMDNALTLDYAFHRFMLKVSKGSAEAEKMEEMVGLITGQKKGDSAYLWDPSSYLLGEIGKLFRIGAMRGKKLVIPDATGMLSACRAKMRGIVDELETAISGSGLVRNGASAYTRSDIPGIVRDGRFTDIVGKALKTFPVNKVKSKDPALAAAYEAVGRSWDRLVGQAHEYNVLYAISYYRPYLSVFDAVNETVEEVKRRQGVIFIEDINRCLASYLDLCIVPDIYFRLGETISHFFIDEFQDTSPIQWNNLYPLLENSLAVGGSVFVVGDTKQAIYSFREADYRIMKSVERENPFRSASHDVRELETNYRSCPEILEYNETVFKKRAAQDEEYGAAARESGLDEYVQKPDPGRRIQGHVELYRVVRDDDAHSEKTKLVEIIESLKARQYCYGDIAILTPQNEDAVTISSWLNDRNIPFISLSSLDIRRRRLTGEIIALLRFLDSPTDNLSFATFVMGEIFERSLVSGGDAVNAGPDFHSFIFSTEKGRPFYKAFQKAYPELWDRYFSGLFRSSGYFPLYDLVTQVYHKFRLFGIFGEEEATLIRLLETVKDFEGQGYNSLAAFLAFAQDGETAEAEWNMDVPTTRDAIQVMTIHKAKGLQFRVTIVLLHERRPRGFDYIVKDDENGFSALRITRDIAQIDEGLERLYRAETLKETVNGLNSLYVGFTRPEEELYVIGVAADPEKNGRPLSILPFEDYQAGPRPDRHPQEQRSEPEDVGLTHRHEEIEFPLSGATDLNLEEKRRGDLIHAALGNIRFVGATPAAAIMEALDPVQRRDIALDEVRMTLEAFLALPETAEYFRERPGRMVWNEKEIVDSGGRLFRIDRLVTDTDRITIIDYKTGGDDDFEERHLPQMLNYMQIAHGIYPGLPVFGVIAYVDQKKLRRLP
jgi:ATP-dependent helicase/nuclease subunit A